MSSSDRWKEDAEPSTSGREMKPEYRPFKEERGSSKSGREGERRREKEGKRSSKSKSPWENRSGAGRPEHSQPQSNSAGPDGQRRESRHSSRGPDSSSHHRDHIEKRFRSEPALREAGEIADERHRDSYKRQRTEDRSRTRLSGHEGSNGREAAGGGEPLPPRRGPLTPSRDGQRASSRAERERVPERPGGMPPSALLSAIPAEIRKAALEAQQREQARKAATAAAQNSDGEMEDPGQVASSGSAHSKHTPIVWNDNSKPEQKRGQVSPLPPSRTVTRTAAEIAALELAEFAQRQAADIDPDAPAALKASPSGSQSGSDEGEFKEAQPMEVDAAPGEDAVAPSQGIRSRWLVDEEEEEAPQSLPNGKGPSVAQEEAELAALNEQEAQDLEAEGEQREANGDGHEWSDDEDSVSEFQATRREINMLNSCRRVGCFERLNRISEGTYGVVYRAKDKETGTICALKRIKMEKERDGFPLTSIREINILLSFGHKNVVDVSEVVVGDSLDQVFMVMEFMEHDLKELMDSMTEPFTVAETKNLMRQLLEGIAYLHSNWVLHRDLKTSNILYNNRGQLKICDFGLARQYGSPLRPYTHNVVTLYYRAIELLLGCKQYSTAIDIWSLGCIMAELLTKKVLFQGTGELDQIDKIFKVLGSPTEETWPGHKELENVKKLKLRYQPRTLRQVVPAASKFSPNSGLTEAGFDLLDKMLALDPKQRISAEDALAHPWFKEQPWPKDNALMPTYPTSKDGTHRSSRQRNGRQPSPGPRPEISGPNFASRTAEIGLLFGK